MTFALLNFEIATNQTPFFSCLPFGIGMSITLILGFVANLLWEQINCFLLSQGQIFRGILFKDGLYPGSHPYQSEMI